MMIHQSASLLLVAVLVSAPAFADQPALERSVYDRATRFLVQNEDNLVLNRSVLPHWRSDGGENFTYVRELGGGRTEFVRVQAATGARSPAFDARVVADGLSRILNKPVQADRLPFRDFDRSGAGTLRFSVAGTDYECSVSRPSCQGQAVVPADPLGKASPDGRWIAFTRDHNLWIRSADGAQAFALTQDGEAHYAYAGTPEANPLYTDTVIRGGALPPVVLWSPDSTHLLTQRLDEREVRTLTIVQTVPVDGAGPPIEHHWRSALSNDSAVPVSEPWIFDLATRSGRRVDVGPLQTPVTTAIEAHETWWAPDGRHAYLFSRSRYAKSMRLDEVDAATGHARILIEESGKTFVEAAANGQRPMVYVLANGEVLWFSERDGVGRLYVYDGATGKLKRRLADGDWSIRNVLHIDEPRGLVYVAGSGSQTAADPYYRKVYRIAMADGRATLLTAEEADHLVSSAQEAAYFDPPPDRARVPAAARGFSPSGRYFLDTYSRADLPAETVLRRADGKLVATVERADISRVVAGGLTPPERFSALAADGTTRLYGNLLKPSDFDPRRAYPIIDSLYPGPQARKAYPRMVDVVFGYTADQTLAELGFIVVQLDGRGTPDRSKAFLDESYGRIGLAGHLDDHVAVLQQLAHRYAYLDLSRIGVYGGSAGGAAALRALLAYPDVFRAGVSAAGSHDSQLQTVGYSEKFMGPDDGQNYHAASNARLAEGLKGKLLLIHGDADWTVPIANTMQVVDALIHHNKEFDLLVVPNVGHSPLGVHGGYALRRSWDFLVENVMGAKPPADYVMHPIPSVP
jgi:dipeptidyl-peptidase 4